MRIALVTQWFPPEPGTVVAAAMADGLAERGHHVEVLTGFPNYPDGRLQDGYPLRSYRRDVRSPRVTVHRAPLYPSHDRSAIRRVLNYASFALAAAWVAWRHVPRPDAWLVYSSPATAALPACAAAGSTPIYLVIQDLWPDSVTQSGMLSRRSQRLVNLTLQRFCAWTYRRAAGIGVISPSMRTVLVARGVDPSKVHDMPNWVDDQDRPGDSPPTPGLRKELGLPDGRLFMYAGNLGELQGLEPLVRAFARVPTAQLAFVGAGIAKPRLQKLVNREEMANISFVDPQASDRIGRYIAASDVQIVSLQDTPLLRATMPSKVQSSLAAGKPILAHAAGDVARLVVDHDLGRACTPGDLTGTVRAIRSLTSCPGADLVAIGLRSRRHYENAFSAAAGLDRLEHLLGSHSRSTAPGQQVQDCA